MVDEAFSAPAAEVLSLGSAVVVVLTGVTAAGLVVGRLLANDAAAGLGVAVVLVGVGLCTVAAAGLAAGLGVATCILGATALTGFGGATLAAGRVLVTGEGRAVVDTALGIAVFSCLGAGGGLGGGTAKAGRNGVECP